MDSVETFKSLFEASPDAVIAVNKEGKIIMASNKVFTLFGYNNDELIGKEASLLIPQSFLHFDSLQIPSEEKEIVQTAYRKDATTFYAEIRVSTVKAAGGFMLVSIRDVTEQRKLYNQLKISNEQFRGAFEYSAIGMALVSTEGKWLKVNKQLCEFLGYTEGELLNKTFQDITHPDDLDLDLAHVGEMLRGERETYQMEKRYFNKNGSIVWVLLSVSLAKDSDGNPIHFVSQINNITQRKITEKALRESEQRWQFALEGAGDGLWDWNTHSNKVFFSSQLKKMLGYADNEIGDTIDEWDKRVHPDDRERCQTDLNMHFSGETPVYLNEHRVLCKDGTYKWILDRGKIIEWTEDGIPLRVIGTHSDITVQKEKEKELHKSLDIIGDQNKRLMNFAHIVSHNLRSHSGNFQLILNLLSTADNETERVQMIELLKENAKTLSDTIMHLNDVVQIQLNTDIKKEKINLKNYIDKTIDILGGEINMHNVLIHNNIKQETEINYNPAYMESVLLNFLSNGIKYRHPARRPEIMLDAMHQEDALVLQIRDNGKGINLEKYGQKLFGLYKTFHGNADAKGIGLFITKNQIEAMGGKIEVDSEINTGTTFKVYIK